jgi:hypothetical protein
VELRVHGIGAPDVDRVLECDEGCPSVVSWRSTAGTQSTIRRRPGENETHAYHWSPLTSGSRSFAIWPLLLPFTLVNVAGWMGPRHRVLGWLHRALVVWVGMTMSAATVVWVWIAARAIFDAVGALPDSVPGSTDLALRFGPAAATLVVMAVLVLGATFTASGYEGYRAASAALPRRPWRGLWGSGFSARLDDPHFFDNATDQLVHWWVHLVVVIGTWAAVAAAIVVSDEWDSVDALAGAITVVAVLQAVGIGGLVMVALPSDGSDRRLTRRLLGAGTATAGIMLLGGLVLSALITIVGIDELPTGPAVIVYDLYGWALLAAVGCAVACVVASLLRPTPAEPRARAFLPTLAARYRGRLALVLGELDLVVAGLFVTFAAGGAVAVVDRWGAMEDRTWRLTSTPPVEIARVSFAFLIGFLILNLWKSKASPDALRRVGNVWDVLTFWPRTYHPFAVRPYAERAVPELQEFLRVGPRRGRLVVTAHSQGSVLLFAALRSTLTDRPLPGFDLITVGSPLRAIYSRVFPRYVDAGDLETTRQAFAGTWLNLFRYTDHIGRAVFRRDEEVVAGVAVGATVADRPLPDGLGAEVRVMGHNDYWVDDTVRRTVADIEQGTVGTVAGTAEVREAVA